MEEKQTTLNCQVLIFSEKSQALTGGSWGPACLFALLQLYLPQQTLNPQIGTISEKAKNICLNTCAWSGSALGPDLVFIEYYSMLLLLTISSTSWNLIVSYRLQTVLCPKRTESGKIRSLLEEVWYGTKYRRSGDSTMELAVKIGNLPLSSQSGPPLTVSQSPLSLCFRVPSQKQSRREMRTLNLISPAALAWDVLVEVAPQGWSPLDSCFWHNFSPFFFFG